MKRKLLTIMIMIAMGVNVSGCGGRKNYGTGPKQPEMATPFTVQMRQIIAAPEQSAPVEVNDVKITDDNDDPTAFDDLLASAMSG